MIRRTYSKTEKLKNNDHVAVQSSFLTGLQTIYKGTRVVHDVREMTHSHVNPSNVIRREHDTSD